MKLSIYNIAFLALATSAMISCEPEPSDLSTVSRFKSFGFETIPSKITVDEADTTYVIPFTFNDDQIFDIEVDLVVGANSTAKEDVDFALVSHTVPVLALGKKGVIEMEVVKDVFLESDESVFITLSGHHPSGFPVAKTVEIVIKNVGGCPEFKIDDYVGTFTVQKDEWQDWAVGSEIEVAKVSATELSFKYNCGADALPIIMKINPATFGISGTKQEYCSYSLPPVTKFLGDIVEASSIVNTCDKVLVVAIAHTDANGTAYGTGAIELKKK